MRRKLFWLGLFFSIPYLAGAKIIDRIAAVVSGEVITESEVVARAYPFLLQIDADTQDPSQNIAKKKLLMKDTLQDLIDEKLLSTAATELQLSVSTEEVDRAIDQILQRNTLSLSDLEQALKQQGTSLKRYREDIRDQLIRYKVIGNRIQSKVNVTDEEATVACESDTKAANLNSGLEVELQQMLFLIPDGATAADIEAKAKKAQEAISRVKAGEDFALVAAQSSEDPNIELGSFDVEGLDPTLSDTLKKANKNDILGPTQEATLFRVLRVVDKRSTAGASCKDRLEDYRAALQEKETEKVLSAYIQELRKKAYIDTKL
jgi:peptidyl-prolyl cis-trans isomerase SurA